jgi:ribosomal protein S21
MIEVEVKNGRIDNALRKLKKEVFRSQVIQECRDRSYYKKPSRKKYERERKALFMSRLRERQNNY